MVGTDDVDLTGGTATFANANVGNNKTVTGTGFTLDGAAAGNYSLASSTLTTTADITAKQLTGNFTAANKVYNGLTGATILTRTLTGVVGTDDVDPHRRHRDVRQRQRRQQQDRHRHRVHARLAPRPATTASPHRHSRRRRTSPPSS